MSTELPTAGPLGGTKKHPLWDRTFRTPSGCLLWLGPTTGRQNVGYLRYEGRMWRANRLAFTLHYGPIPTGLSVCHKQLCPSALCIEPSHLYAGTQLDNMRDLRELRMRMPHARGGTVTDLPRTHKFVTIEQVVRDEQPEIANLPELFEAWGLVRSTQELMWVIAIDNMTGIKTVTEIARGGYHDVLVYPANVLAAVLAAHTDRFFIAHNHPSGPVTPTEDDLRLTHTILNAANAAGLSFEDHIIVGPEGTYSMAEAGLLIVSDELGIRSALKKTRSRAAGGER